MRSRTRGRTALLAAGLVLLPAGAWAGGGSTILWDQSDVAFDENALLDSDFLDFPAYSGFMLMDVEVDGPGWRVETVATFFTIGFAAWSDGNIKQAYLNILPKDGELPDDGYDPFDAPLVDVDLTDLGGVWDVRASGLDIDLPPGEYWIGLTPSYWWGATGKEYHWGSPIRGGNTAWRNPGGALGFGEEWTFAYNVDTTGSWRDQFDGAIRIEGTIEPACVGDLNLDGEIGLVDLSTLLEHYATFGGAEYFDGDLDLDDDVDIADLSLLLSRFGDACE